MSDPASWVQASAEVGLLAVATWALIRDGFQARRARAQTAQVAVEAKAEQDAIATEVQKIETPQQALALAETLRVRNPVVDYYENMTGLKLPEVSSVADLILRPTELFPKMSKGMEEALSRHGPDATVAEVREAEERKAGE